MLTEPRTVVEMFKLMVVFDKLDLPNDNPRKYMTEGKEGFSGTHKGHDYGRSLEEENELTDVIRKIALN